MRLCIDFEWTDVGTIRLESSGKLQFPDLPEAAGIYRLRLSSGAQHSIYIGETDDLRRRAAHYRNPGPTQATNIRLNDHMRRLLAAGGTAQVAVAANAGLAIDGTAARLDLAQKAHRCLLENAVLVAAMNSGTEQIENL